MGRAPFVGLLVGLGVERRPERHAPFDYGTDSDRGSTAGDVKSNGQRTLTGGGAWRWSRRWLCTGDQGAAYRRRLRESQGSIQAEPCAKVTFWTLWKAQKPKPVEVPALTMPRIVGVEVLDAHQGSQEAVVSAQVGDVRADEEARGPADGHAEVRVRC